jgi:hypothetical protein
MGLQKQRAFAQACLILWGFKVQVNGIWMGVQQSTGQGGFANLARSQNGNGWTPCEV